MASSELIIDDEYCTAMGTHFLAQGMRMDQLIIDYIGILREIEEKAIVSGEVSKALAAYINYAEKLKKQIGPISNSLNKQILSFLAQVDAADEYLF